jgi:hypothetical protein
VCVCKRTSCRCRCFRGCAAVPRGGCHINTHRWRCSCTHIGRSFHHHAHRQALCDGDGRIVHPPRTVRGADTRVLVLGSRAPTQGIRFPHNVYREQSQLFHTLVFARLVLDGRFCLLWFLYSIFFRCFWVGDHTPPISHLLKPYGFHPLQHPVATPGSIRMSGEDHFSALKPPRAKHRNVRSCPSFVFYC